MRRPVSEARIRQFLRSLGVEAKENTRVYFAGGATAVLLGWRPTTVDVDIRIHPQRDTVLRAIPRLKEELQLNVELASPADFLPELPGWRDRSTFIAREGKITFYHYDFYSQALSKVQRGHAKDLEDVRRMLMDGLVEPGKALSLFEAIEDELYHFPAIDPASFRRRVEVAFGRR
ncbi:MAG TPA: DUF6036 family nucleotidyltransferase [Vicinamibacteria bacterium]|nr:DUF6036 family nucleotidyltransferase [Vicinamibacteria bacterium]